MRFGFAAREPWPLTLVSSPSEATRAFNAAFVGMDHSPFVAVPLRSIRRRLRGETVRCVKSGVRKRWLMTFEVTTHVEDRQTRCQASSSRCHEFRIRLQNQRQPVSLSRPCAGLAHLVVDQANSHASDSTIRLNHVISLHLQCTSG